MRNGVGIVSDPIPAVGAYRRSAAQGGIKRTSIKEPELLGIARLSARDWNCLYAEGPCRVPIAVAHSPKLAVTKGEKLYDRLVYDASSKRLLLGHGVNFYYSDEVAGMVFHNNQQVGLLAVEYKDGGGISFDVSTAYHRILVHKHDRQFLGSEIEVDGVSFWGRYSTLPMGVKPSSAIFDIFMSYMMRAAKMLLGVEAEPGALEHYADDGFGFSMDRSVGNRRLGFMVVMGSITGLPMTKLVQWTREPIYMGLQYFLLKSICKPKPKKLQVLEDAWSSLVESDYSPTQRGECQCCLWRVMTAARCVRGSRHAGFAKDM